MFGARHTHFNRARQSLNQSKVVYVFTRRSHVSTPGLCQTFIPHILYSFEFHMLVQTAVRGTVCVCDRYKPWIYQSCCPALGCCCPLHVVKINRANPSVDVLPTLMPQLNTYNWHPCSVVIDVIIN